MINKKYYLTRYSWSVIPLNVDLNEIGSHVRKYQPKIPSGEYANESQKISSRSSSFVTDLWGRALIEKREKTWRGPDARDEPKIRAKWLAGPVVSCDRKWHSFLASSRPSPPSSTKSRKAGIRPPSFISPSSASLLPSFSSSLAPRRVVTYPFLHARTDATTTEDYPLLATR